MKFKVISTVFMALAMISIQSNAQLTFSLASGKPQNTASFGYKINKFEPRIGLNLINANFNYTETGHRIDDQTLEIVSYEDKLKVSGTVFMPTIGVKYTFLESGKLQAYGILNFTKVIVKAKIEDSNDPTANADLQEQLKKIKVFGGQLGFGTEYFFDKQFSVGGEFGLMLMHVKSSNTIHDELFDEVNNVFVPVTITQTSKVGISPTYAKVSMNFYFGKN